MALLGRVALLVLALAAIATHQPRTLQPSFVLVVLDTTRFDAVAANGGLPGTTPVIDALAASGLRYTRAYTQSHWTLPSHTTLFSGLPPSQHGVDWRTPMASDGLVTVAEVLRAAGWDTFGVSENPWVSKRRNLAQGFERFVLSRPQTDGVETAIASWMAERSSGRPYFLFVNLMDAHPPLSAEPARAFLPPDVSAEEVAATLDAVLRRFRLCDSPLSERTRAILRAQYASGVARADARLGGILEGLGPARDGAPRIVIVTSDHGELLGEHGYLNHWFGLYEELLRVPLVVHGLPGIDPAVVSTPVTLSEIAPSIVRWAGLPRPRSMDSPPLPKTSDPPSPARIIVAEHTDPAGTTGDSVGRAMREGCDPEGPLFGDARAAIVWPEKLHAYASAPAELFDLEADPGELVNLATSRTSRLQELQSALPPPARREGPTARAAAAEPPHPDDVERLRALGYLANEP